VFGAAGARFARLFTGAGERVATLRDTMMTAWARFIQGQAPCHPQLPAWPRHDLARRATMCLGREFSILHDPLAERHDVWERAL
jgi:para-nitrobenzyl esterase